MKDITASVFGLLIAYVLPGFVAISGVMLFVARPEAILRFGEGLNSSSAPLVFLILASLVTSLVIGAARYILFEKFLYTSGRFERRVYKKLGTADGLLAFRQAIDEHYRYYQFHGGMVFALPFLAAGVLLTERSKLTIWNSLLIVFAFALLEVLEFRAGADQLRATFERGRMILDDEDDPAERLVQISETQIHLREDNQEEFMSMTGGNPSPQPTDPGRI